MNSWPASGGTPRRNAFVDKLRTVVPGFMAEGASGVLVGGSFTSAKRAPGDMDLLVLGADRHPAWGGDASRTPLHVRTRDSVNGVTLMNEARIDAYPAEFSILRPSAVITDSAFEPPQLGEGMFEFFQHERHGAQRVIVLLDDR